MSPRAGEPKPAAVVVQAPAKLNFGLRILSRRSDGYHEIESVMLPLDLCDTLRVEPAPSPGIRLCCEGAALPEGPGNLAVRGAETACRALGIEPRLALTLTKRIPVAAGLGGGSSDAAAALGAVERLHGLRLDAERRWTLAREIGADVPFFLDPRPAVARGVGERLEPISGLPERVWVLVALPFEVSTPEIYAAASRELTLPRPPSRIPALSSLLSLGGPRDAEPSAGAEAAAAEGVFSPENDLERITGRRHPEVGDVQRNLRARGARITGMSGSGPTVYGGFSSDGAARAALRDLELPAGARAWVVHSPAAPQVTSRGRVKSAGA